MVSEPPRAGVPRGNHIIDAVDDHDVVVAEALENGGGAQMCLHFSLPDAEVCGDMRAAVSARIVEVQLASVTHQKEAYRTAETLRGSELMFGYVLPDEDVSDDVREAVQLIFSQASMPALSSRVWR